MAGLRAARLPVPRRGPRAPARPAWHRRPVRRDRGPARATGAVAALFAAAAACSGVPRDLSGVDAGGDAACGGTRAADPAFAAVLAFARASIEASRVPGAAIAIARDGAVAHAGAVGSREAGRCSPVTVDTRFDTAFSRHVTAAAVAAAVAAGDAAYDDRIADWMPAFAAAGPYDSGEVTVDHALLNTAGYSLNHTRACDDLDAFFAAHREVPLWSPPGRIHLELLLHTTLAATALGSDLHARVRALVVDPLGLDATYDRVAAAKGDFAFGHVLAGDEVRTLPAELRACPPSEPYRAPLVSILDAARLLAPLADGDHPLTDGVADAFYPPERATRGGFVRGPFDGEVDVASADVAAFGSAYAVRIVPHDRFAVVVFENASYGDPGAIADEAIRVFLGRRRAVDATPPAPADPAALVGRYRDPLGGAEIVIAAGAGGGLTASLDGAPPVPLVPARRDGQSFVRDLFEFRRAGDRIERVRIWRDPDGRAEAISQSPYPPSLGPPLFRAP